MPGIQAQLPAGMKVGMPYDSTEYIQDAIARCCDADRDAADRRRRDLPVPRLGPRRAHPGRRDSDLARRRGVPDAGAGFTINLLTLLAIVLSVGLVVDDAIVMVENVERHLHEGKRPSGAAIDARRELVGPIIAMTITLAAVYAPIGIQGG
jgi:multidrug efflux pump